MGLATALASRQTNQPSQLTTDSGPIPEVIHTGSIIVGKDFNLSLEDLLSLEYLAAFLRDVGASGRSEAC